MSRPLVYGEKTAIAATHLPYSVLDHFDALAAKAGVTRSAVLRDALMKVAATDNERAAE